MLRTFLTGAIGYPMLEMLYRGRTHYSMALAGGCSACIIIRCVGETKHHMITKALMSGVSITVVELLCGMIWNRDHKVWDYRKMPMNYRGQICMPYLLLWCSMSACILPLLRPQKTSRR